METATWILVIFLSITLFVFLVVGIVLIAKLIDLTNEAKRVIIKGQDIAEKTDGIVQNVKDMTSIGGVVKTFVNKYNSDNKSKKSKEQNARQKH